MQTRALLFDSIRLLISKRLFWITLAINLIVVVMFGSIGFTENGVSLLFGLYEIHADERFRAGSLVANTLYLGIFSSVIVSLWLAWVATALALLSTTSVFPDFLAEGAIDMVLSKPISRVKVFFVKYVGALLFVFVQVSVFCIGAFLCVGFRLDQWKWSLFAAIPLVTVFYSYLFSFNVLVAIVTRSSIAALIFTGLFWLGLWFVQSGETIANQIATRQEVQISALESRNERDGRRFAALAAAGESSESSDEFESLRGKIEQREKELAEIRDWVETSRGWHGIFVTTRNVLPKNQETINLLSRWVLADSPYTLTDVLSGPPRRFDDERRSMNDQIERETGRRMQEDYNSRSAWFIILSSLAFEAVMLGIAAWIFVRRDF